MMRNRSAWIVCLFAIGMVTSSLFAAGKPEVIVVLGDLTMQHSEGEGRGARQFCDEVKKALKDLGIPFTDSRDTAVEKGALAGHKIAIFPYSAFWSKEEEDAAVKFTQQGGKLVCFYTVPGSVRTALGIKMLKMRPGNRRGEFDAVRFNERTPANFPESFKQGSPNSQIVEALDGAKVIAEWCDESGKTNGLAAIVQSDNGFYMGHVFKGGDFAGHKAYLLGVIGHYLPHVWEGTVKPTLTMIEKVGRFDSLEALAAAFGARGMEQTSDLKDALAKRAKAKTLFADKQYRDAMAVAHEARALATSAYARLFPSRKVELRACWLGFPSKLEFEQVMKTLAANGFNAVFPLMCSAGVAYYNSDVLPQATNSCDKLAECVKWARHYGIEVHVWRMNWQLSGGSKETIDEQKKQGRCIVEFAAAKEGKDDAINIYCPSDPRNRKLELDAMVEVVRKYDVDGIHFDYMRYGGWNQCYCKGCHERFESWLGRKVDQWPDDCHDKGPLAEKYRDWR
ncbi:MAG: family 10 glycosylhydrolase, partial [Kiritimatiellae bacterium]|nr:family 10 glycosylhydrolase [Kiritimatiellia bacterium]